MKIKIYIRIFKTNIFIKIFISDKNHLMFDLIIRDKVHLMLYRIPLLNFIRVHLALS